VSAPSAVLTLTARTLTSVPAADKGQHGALRKFSPDGGISRS
jgi:hypothetical protein